MAMSRGNRLMLVSMPAIVGALLTFLVGCPTQQAAEETPPAPPQPVAEDQPSPNEGEQATGMMITSTAFKNGERIPVKYTADGENVSPPLQWTGVPEETIRLALICHDPDAPREGGFTHWVLYGLQPNVSGLPENMPKTTSGGDVPCLQGFNSAGKPGYMGPSPPPGKPHRYQFTLYALSDDVTFEAPPDRAKLLKAMEGHITAQTTLEGLYGR